MWGKFIGKALSLQRVKPAARLAECPMMHSVQEQEAFPLGHEDMRFLPVMQVREILVSAQGHH
jgi:hypothetical protein